MQRDDTCLTFGRFVDVRSTFTGRFDETLALETLHHREDGRVGAVFSIRDVFKYDGHSRGADRV